MAINQLLSRLGDAEDNFVERKPANPNRDVIRKTVVAFANSVPEGRTAVLFVGIRNDGTVEAVPNPDKLQKTVREICEQDCYPPIKFTAEVLKADGSLVLAIVVPASNNKPHFAGPAYVRRGSESVAASAEVFDELVHSRNSKCAAVLKLKGQVVSVLSLQHKLGVAKHIPDTGYREAAECRVEAANAQTVRLRILGSDRYVTEPLDHAKVCYDEEGHRPMLVVTGY
ncbi:MAG: ATP-binding protein [Betaproteobacteria bacterium]|nr:ATP-binding protein [Betaproteobacteria bacterium]